MNTNSSGSKNTQRTPKREVSGASGTVRRTPQSTDNRPVRTPAKGTPVPRKTGGTQKSAPSKPRTSGSRPTQQNSTKQQGRDNPSKGSIFAGNTIMSSLVKAIIYIVVVIIVSGFLSYFAISIGNDIFAFVKDDTEITVNIENGTDIEQLGKILEEKGVIKYAGFFKLYAQLRNKSPDLVAGEYKVSAKTSYDELIAIFAKQTQVERTTVVVVIPEGFTVDDIINKLVNVYGLSSRNELVNAIQNEDFDYWFVDELENSTLRAGRKYRLEGYLYPDTYYYYSDADAKTIINKMLSNFQNKLKTVFGDDPKSAIEKMCQKSGMTFDDHLVIASMIQTEAKYEIDYPYISAVFHNRLKNPSVTNGKLDSDATIQYALPERVKELTAEHLKVDSPYNTYLYRGLPPGPIANPAFNAIHYSFYPDDDGKNYYYFVAGNDGYSLFAKTYAQHQANIKSLKKK